MRSLLLLLSLLFVAIVSCDDTAVPDPDPDELVLRVITSGGCDQLGWNCPMYEVFGDGTVNAYRWSPSIPFLVDTGSIDNDLVQALHREVSLTDLDALRERLPEGECRGCVDGIDTAMRFSGSPLTFSSVDVELDRSEPVFAAAWAVYEAAQAVVEVPVVAR